jgi:PhnB protein
MKSVAPTTITVHEVYPYLRVRGAADAIAFYKRAFGAHELFRLREPAGRIGHAEIKIGPMTIMIADEYPEYGIQGPQALGGTSVAMHLHVDNVDALMQQAVEAGGTVTRELADHFYGERSGVVRDPFGHEWLLGQQIEEVTPEEMQRRFTATLSTHDSQEAGPDHGKEPCFLKWECNLR